MLQYSAWLILSQAIKGGHQARSGPLGPGKAMWAWEPSSWFPCFLQPGNIKVSNLYHWPGETNVADLATKGCAEGRDVIKGSVWQDGPVQTRYPVDSWPISRDFVREIPEEEKKAAVYGAHQSISLLSEIREKTRVRRDVVHQVALQSPTHGQTGSQVRSEQHLGHPLDVREQGQNVKVRSKLENVIRLREIINSVMLRINNFK